MTTPARSLVGVAIAISLALVVTYFALGGGSYEPTPVADPCEPREWRSPEGVEEAAEQFALSALDGAACELRVTRETLAVALATEDSRAEFATQYGVDAAQLEEAVRAGILRAIGDAEAAGALPPLAAEGLAVVAANLPVEELVALIDDASAFFDDAGGFLGGLGLEGVLD